MGYNLSAEELRDLAVDVKKDLNLAPKSSLANLITSDKNQELNQLLTGDSAFRTLITKAGLDAVPAKQDVAPFADDKYFDRGYNTRRYTSSKYPNVFGR